MAIDEYWGITIKNFFVVITNPLPRNVAVLAGAGTPAGFGSVCDAQGLMLGTN